MTNIEWTQKTDNFIVVKSGGFFCIKESEGCAGCYSEAINQNSFFGGNGLRYSGKAPEMELKEDVLLKWAKMRVPYLHFCSSMTDIFGSWVKLEWQLQFLRAMKNAPKQVFQLLTKHPENMLIAVNEFLYQENLSMLPDNIAVGTSVENFNWLKRRSLILQSIPAKIHFLSCEPIIDQVFGLPDVDYSEYLKDIQWTILGAESSNSLQPNARKCYVEWIQQGIEAGQKFDIPVFVKQLGSNPWKKRADDRMKGTPIKLYLNHKKGGDITEWDESLQVRQFPKEWEQIVARNK